MAFHVIYDPPVHYEDLVIGPHKEQEEYGTESYWRRTTLEMIENAKRDKTSFGRDLIEPWTKLPPKWAKVWCAFCHVKEYPGGVLDITEGRPYDSLVPFGL